MLMFSFPATEDTSFIYLLYSFHHCVVFLPSDPKLFDFVDGIDFLCQPTIQVFCTMKELTVYVYSLCCYSAGLTD